MGHFTDIVKNKVGESDFKDLLKKQVLQYKKDEESAIRAHLNSKIGHILSFKDSNNKLVIGKLKSYSIVYLNDEDFEVTLEIKEEK